jgi:predicted phosphodiesterase
MIAHVMSDIHTENMDARQFAKFVASVEVKIKKDKPKACFLAGDIGSPFSFKSFGLAEVLEEIAQMYPATYYVPGNHEWWGGDLVHTEDFYSRISPLYENSDLHLRQPNMWGDYMLSPDGKSYGTTKVLYGGTGWFREPLPYLKISWTEYAKIKNLDSAPKINAMGGRQIIESASTERFRDLDKIVMTHYIPTHECVSEKYKNNPFNDFFVGGFEEVIETVKPKLWIFGHTHDPIDQVVGETRCYSNPYGYESEKTNPNFLERLAIDV